MWSGSSPTGPPNEQPLPTWPPPFACTTRFYTGILDQARQACPVLGLALGAPSQPRKRRCDPPILDSDSEFKIRFKGDVINPIEEALCEITAAISTSTTERLLTWLTSWTVPVIRRKTSESGIAAGGEYMTGEAGRRSDRSSRTCRN